MASDLSTMTASLDDQRGRGDTPEDRLRFVLRKDVSFSRESEDRIRVQNHDGHSVVIPVPMAQALLEFIKPRSSQEALGAVGLYVAPEEARIFARKLAELGCLVPSSPPEPAGAADSGAGVPDYLSLSPEAQGKMAIHLRKGDVCIIRDAFEPALAQSVHEALATFDGWKPYEDFKRYFFFRHHNIYEQRLFPPALERCRKLFSSASTRRWISSLSGRDCLGEPGVGASLYLPGDHSLPHDDSGPRREVAFVWHLTRDWDPTWGGDFCWCSPTKVVAPSFNTLIVFNVVPRQSHHFVSTVSPMARGRRFAVNGWWMRTEPRTEPSLPPTLDRFLEAAPNLLVIERP
jgi:hypothetical protein